MASIVIWFAFFLLLHLEHLNMVEAGNRSRKDCPNFSCGHLQSLKFPFFSTQMPSNCGLYKLNCSTMVPEIQLEEGGRWYAVQTISQANMLNITDTKLQKLMNSSSCSNLSSFSLPNSSWLTSTTVYKCNKDVKISISGGFRYQHCDRDNLYYNLPRDNSEISPPECVAIQIPTSWAENRTISLKATFSIQIKMPSRCYGCHYGGGRCITNNRGRFECQGGKKGRGNIESMKLGLGIGGTVILIIISAALLIIKPCFRRNTSDLISRNISAGPCSKSDIETSNVYLRIPIFSYKELEEATNNFSGDKLLGDGGFGTVYYGKLQDGREVAVKRLYEHNFRRVEQFMNEIEILTRLQHKNLVSLYGCTSRRSRELLLVYEFVPNGTLADHLHGHLAKPGSLTWSMRMSIAIETSSALAYLHASDIIHRDVKTNNILLDRNFSVKVADFGLSRLLPNDVTHVSTAPQGTPGYVDPEYHQCYHLTDKSDVYSFGVVLVELMSSMPAVDMNRSKTEINLSNLAINKIQKHALHELIDPNLSYQTNDEVKNMARLVAELAFQCLQQDKDMRPTMDEVAQELKRIQNGEFTFHAQEESQNDNEEEKRITPPLSPANCDEALLLKNIRLPPSPISVTEQWISRSTTPNTSREGIARSFPR